MTFQHIAKGNCCMVLLSSDYSRNACTRHNSKIFVQNFQRAVYHFRESYPVTTLCGMLPMQHTLVCPGSLWYYTRWKHLMTSFCLPDVHTQALLLNTFYSLKKCLSFLLHPITVRVLYSLFKNICHVDPINFEFHFRIARKKNICLKKGALTLGGCREPQISSSLSLHRGQRLREVK